MKGHKKQAVLVLAAAGVGLLVISSATFSHCEIPCGIYGDPLRLDLMAEHIQTIEKSMAQINEISSQQEKNYNQLVRWTTNKDDHADAFCDIITQYFLKQRIKPASKDDSKAYDQYIGRLTLLHEMMVVSMKCKQTTDIENTAKLRTLLTKFRLDYLGPVASHAH